MTKSEIQLVKSLTDKHAREEAGLFLAEGDKFISELLTSPLRVQKIFTCQERFTGEIVERVAPREMERLSLLKTASSSVALIEIPHYKLSAEALCGQLVLALDQVQNPGNLGTIIRLADWFGISDIVCSEESADCFNPKVVQATMGAILRVRVHYTPLPPLLHQLRALGTPICGTFLEGCNIYHEKLPKAAVIVMGNEGRGITPAVAAEVSQKLFVPPYPADRAGSESLNVAMATGVICAEFRRQGALFQNE